MATRSPARTTTTAATTMAEALKHQLDASTSATIYVPLDDGDTPTEDDLKALEAEGIHAEVDAVRGALAARRATEDEIAAATAPAVPAEPTPTAPAE